MKEIVDTTKFIGVDPVTGEKRRVVIVRENGKHSLGFCPIPVINNSVPTRESTKLVQE